MPHISQEPPITNRGVVNTLENEKTIDFKGEINNLGQFILFDWFQFTIHYEFSDFASGAIKENDKYYLTGYIIYNKVVRLFKDLFNINNSDILYENKGINGYTSCYYYNNIKMYVSDKMEMGINILMSGKGCRDFDRLGLDYKDLIISLKKYCTKYNRIDISIDDFTNNYFTLGKLKKSINKGLVVSKFRTYFYMHKGIIETNEILGDTIQFGSRASEVQITFYDKLKERINNNYLVADEIKYWVRTELRFRDKKINELLDRYISENISLNELAKGILYNYINFVDKSNDSNKCRWQTSNWWKEYLENINKLRFLPATLETTITRKKKWIDNTTSKSNFIVFLSELNDVNLDEYTTDYIFNYFKKGYSELTDKDIQLINDYRISKKLNPWTKEEIKDYINDLQDLILVKASELGVIK